MLITIAMTLTLKKRGKMKGSSRTPLNTRMLSVFVSPVKEMSLQRGVVVEVYRDGGVVMKALGNDDRSAVAGAIFLALERHRRGEVEVHHVIIGR